MSAPTSTQQAVRSEEETEYGMSFLWDAIKEVNEDVEIIGQEESEELRRAYVELIKQSDLELDVIRSVIIDCIFLSRDAYNFAENARKFYLAVMECSKRKRALAEAESRLFGADSEGHLTTHGSEDIRSLQAELSDLFARIENEQDNFLT